MNMESKCLRQWISRDGFSGVEIVDRAQNWYDITALTEGMCRSEPIRVNRTQARQLMLLLVEILSDREPICCL